MQQAKFLGALVLFVGSALAGESPIDAGPILDQNDVGVSNSVPETTAMPHTLPESAALRAIGESLPIPEAHVSTQIHMGPTNDDVSHSGGPKVRKAAQSSTREMTASSTVSPTSTLHVNDNGRDNRDRFYPDNRYDNRYPDYRYDNRYNQQLPSRGYGGYGGGYGAPTNDYDRGYYRGSYNPYYNDPWRQNFYDPYYDHRAGSYYNNYGRDGRSYGERPLYPPYGNEYFYPPDRIDPYRFGYSTDKLGRGFGYSCKNVFECQDLKNREEAAREAQRRSYGPPLPPGPYNQQYHPSPAPYHPSSATYRAPYENANLWYPPTAAPTSGRSVTYFPQDRYDSYYGNQYTGGYGFYGGYTPYYSDRYRDYYRGKKK